jgi:hypothetical protein
MDPRVAAAAEVFRLEASYQLYLLVLLLVALLLEASSLQCPAPAVVSRLALHSLRPYPLPSVALRLGVSLS